MTDYEPLKLVLLEAANAAANVHRKYYLKEFQVESKSTSFDLVTTTDLEAEKEIVSIIRHSFPSHNILAEEARYEQQNSEYCWIIDPLDGTNNFAHGMPNFSVSIALEKAGEVILGVVYDPIREEKFFAEKGKGSFLNDKAINVSQVQDLGRAILITGFPYDRGEDLRNNLKHIEHFFEAGITGIRRFGSAALDLCYVACGRASGYWEYQLNPWDFAAGKLICEEAGGMVTNLKGDKIPLSKSSILASNGRLNQSMLQILRQVS